MSVQSQCNQTQCYQDSEPLAGSTSDDTCIGKRLGKFQIVRALGRGGMGVVFEARDTVLDRHVAIKLLPQWIGAQPEALQRFLREARAAAKLYHANVVAVHESDQIDGQYYIVLELVRGGSMQDVLQLGSLGWVEATRVLTDAARGLEAAHRVGLLHRDIKPSNLMRSADGTVKLSDFGLARPSEPTGTTMTGSGSVLGTPQYMSPEQCRSERADERSDLYAMGATYYALLTGEPPYPGDAPLLVMNAHVLDPIPDPRELDTSIPEACSAVIRRAMAKDPDDRYANAADMIADLQKVLASTESADVDASIWPSCPPAVAATTAASAKSLETELGSLFNKLDRRLANPPRRATRAVKLIAASVVMAVAVAIGWQLGTGSLQHESSTVRTAQPIGDAGAKQPIAGIPQAVGRDIVDAPQAAVVDRPLEAFRLPGLVRDPQLSNARHDVWSMEYPNLSRLCLANSGEFLVVLTNVPTSTWPTWRGQVTVWHRDGTQRLAEGITGRATSVAISADSTRLVVGTTGGQGVLLWDMRSWDITDAAVASSRDDVEAVALSPNGRWLAYAVSNSSTDGEWVLWDIAAHQVHQRRVVSGAGNLRAIEFAPNDELLVATGGRDGIVRHWRSSQAELVPPTHEAGQPIYAIAFRPGAHLQATGYGKWFSLWDYQRDVRTFVRSDLPVQVDDVAFSPNGQFVCVSSGALVEIFDADSGRVVETLTGFGGRVLSLAFTTDGSEFFAASAIGKLTVWRSTTHRAAVTNRSL